MIRIDKLTDYGVVLLIYMSMRDRETAYNARDLAGVAHLPRPMVGKILKNLAKAGILVSRMGVKGGYRLYRSPEEITVAEIVEALQGPIAITECVSDEPASCGIETLCPTRTNWRRINEAVRSALDGISLAQMARPLDVSWDGARSRSQTGELLRL